MDGWKDRHTSYEIWPRADHAQSMFSFGTRPVNLDSCNESQCPFVSLIVVPVRRFVCWAGVPSFYLCMAFFRMGRMNEIETRHTNFKPDTLLPDKE